MPVFKFPLFIVGSGSQARYVIENVRRLGEFELAGVADIENPANRGKRVNGVPVVCTVQELEQHFPPDAGKLVLAYGDNRTKHRLAVQLEERGYAFATVVSPHAYLSEGVSVGHGTIINPMAVVMPNAEIGRHVILHSQVVVEHDCTIGDCANLAPGVSLGGRVRVGEGAYLYTGCSVIPKVRIGAWSVVAAGAVVTRDVGEGQRVAGVPARDLSSPSADAAAGGRQEDTS